MPSSHKTPKIRTEPIVESHPDSILSIMATLARFEKTREANEIVGQHEDDEKRMAELRKLLKTAPEDLKKKLDRIIAQVINKVSFMRLKTVSQTEDALKKRERLIALLEDHGISYKKFL